MKEQIGMPLEDFTRENVERLLPGIDLSGMTGFPEDEPEKNTLTKFPSFAKHPKVEPNRWLVRNLIPDPGLTMFVGRPESGKSLLSILTMACVGTGQPFVGLAVQRSRFSLIVDAENGMAEMIRRGHAFNLQHLHTVRFWCLDDPKLGIPPKNPLDPIYVAIAKNNRCPIVFDPLSYFTNGKLNSPEDVVPVVEKFKQLSMRYRIPIIINHHSSDKNEANQYLGSTLIRSVLDAGHFVELTTDPENKHVQNITLSTMKARRTSRVTLGVKIDWEDGTYEPWISERKRDLEKAIKLSKAGETERQIAKKLDRGRDYVRRLLGRR